MPEMIPSITAAELSQRLKEPNPPVVLDVREAQELDVSHLEGAIHVPMGQLPSRVDELDKGRELVVICRSGSRSGQVVQFLRGQGFSSVYNLTGGINGWAREVDPSLPTY